MLQIATVLCPLDFSPLSERALNLATRVAQLFGSRLILQHDLKGEAPIFFSRSWDFNETSEKERESAEAEAERKIRAAFGGVPKTVPVEALLTHGSRDDTILHVARSVPADLIVMASHGPSGPGHPSITERVVANAPCPVLAVHEAPEGSVPRDLEAGRPLRVVVPVDFSDHAIKGLRYAQELAEKLLATVHVVHVGVPKELVPPPFRDKPEEIRRKLDELLPEALAANVVVREGVAINEIERYAEQVDADLIAMGVHSKGPIERFLFGSTGTGVLFASRRPVLFVPSCFPSPVSGVGAGKASVAVSAS